MLMNDLNTVDRTEKTVSPLKHDYKGRFSRKGQLDTEKKWSMAVVDSILIALYLTFLLSTDFILFAGSGNVEIFRNSVIPIPEVLYTLGGFLAFSICYVLLFHNYTQVKYGTAAFISFGFVYVLFKQFYQLQQLVAIGDMRFPSYWIMGIILAAVVYIIFLNRQILYKILLVVAAGVLFIHVYSAYTTHKEPNEFIESYNTMQSDNQRNQRFIYFLLPNLVSYPYLTSMATPDAVETQKIMQGFYQTNNFKIYPKAYAPEIGYLGNMILSLNPSSEQASKDYVLNTRLLAEYWRFYNLRNEYIYLKDNELYDLFNQHGFQISAYKSRDFDMCHKEHQPNVNRCVEKVNQPINIYDMKLSVPSKINILLVEWLSSMQIFKNMTSLYNALTSFVNLDKIPMVGVNYNNLYVVNSTKTFDILLNNIKNDEGKQAYFVFADIPSDMYIYDEFCQLKDKEEWLDIANLPWITTDYSNERQKAYLQQTRCLFGKLEQFMEKMEEDGLLENTAILIQGTSGVNNFQNYHSNDFIQSFVGNRLVTMAIYDNDGSGIDKSFCSTSNILSDYLYDTKKCIENNNMGVHETLYNRLNDKIDKFLLNIEKDSTAFFSEWYKQWESHNSEKNTDINAGE